MPQHISKKKISFHKTPTGGGSPFYETFSQNRFFLNDGFPKGGLPKKTVFFGNFSQNGGGSSGRAFLTLYNPSHKIES